MEEKNIELWLSVLCVIKSHIKLFLLKLKDIPMTDVQSVQKGKGLKRMMNLLLR